MTVLASATEVSQKDGEAGDWEHCGEACAASLCDDDNQSRPVSDVVSWLKQRGLNPDQGTPEGWIVMYLQAHGIPCHIYSGNDAIDGALSRRHNLISLVYSDGLGNPNGSRHTTHYIRVWGHDGAGVHCMNPLGSPTFGRNHVYSSGDFYNNSCASGIEIDKVLSKDAPKEEDDMAVLARSARDGGVYLVANAIYGPKRHIAAGSDEGPYLAAGVQWANIDQYILDRMETGSDITANVQNPPEA